MELPSEVQAKIYDLTISVLMQDGAGAATSLVDIFIDIATGSSPSIWDLIRDQVAQMIDQKIAQYYHDNLSAHITGLGKDIDTLKNHVDSGVGLSDIIATSNSILVQFGTYEPLFQLSEWKWSALPLYAQFTNLRLSFMRYNYEIRAQKGAKKEDLKAFRDDMVKAMRSSRDYVSSTYKAGISNFAAGIPVDRHRCEPFRSVNAMTRYMTLNVLDLSSAWLSMVPDPDPADIETMRRELSREIYSDPVGTADNADIQLPGPPTGHLIGMQVFAGDRINDVVCGYEDGMGPGGCTTTSRIWRGGDNIPPYGGRVQVLPDKPLCIASGKAGDVVESLIFYHADISSTRQFGKGQGGSDFSFSYDKHELSSCHSVDANHTIYDCISAMIFGFRLSGSYGLQE